MDQAREDLVCELARGDDSGDGHGHGHGHGVHDERCHNCCKNLILSKEQKALGIPPSLIYMAGLIVSTACTSSTTSNDHGQNRVKGISKAKDKDKAVIISITEIQRKQFETLQNLFHDTKRTAKAQANNPNQNVDVDVYEAETKTDKIEMRRRLFVLSPRLLPTREQQALVDHDVICKLKHLEDKANRVALGLIQQQQLKQHQKQKREKCPKRKTQKKHSPKISKMEVSMSKYVESVSSSTSSRSSSGDDDTNYGTDKDDDEKVHDISGKKYESKNEIEQNSTRMNENEIPLERPTFESVPPSCWSLKNKNDTSSNINMENDFWIPVSQKNKQRHHNANAAVINHSSGEDESDKHCQGLSTDDANAAANTAATLQMGSSIQGTVCKNGEEDKGDGQEQRGENLENSCTLPLSSTSISKTSASKSLPPTYMPQEPSKEDDSGTSIQNNATPLHQDDNFHTHIFHQPIVSLVTTTIATAPLQQQIHDLEIQLQQTKLQLKREREEHVQSIRSERERHDDQIQALQMRLYISDTKCKNYEDALRQHVVAVKSTCMSGIGGGKGAEKNSINVSRSNT